MANTDALVDADDDRRNGSPTLAWGPEGTSRGLVRPAFRCRILQGLAQSSDDRCDAARAHIAASAGARCPDRRHPHEVALD